MTPKVMLVEESVGRQWNLSAAEMYGHVVTVCPPGERRPSLFTLAEYGAHVIRRLRQLGFSPASDHLLMTGTVLGVSAAFAAAALEWPEFNVLLYNSATEVYVSKRIKRADFAADAAELAAELKRKETENETSRPERDLGAGAAAQRDGAHRAGDADVLPKRAKG
jgi:hypothetical protein